MEGALKFGEGGGGNPAKKGKKAPLKFGEFWPERGRCLFKKGKPLGGEREGFLKGKIRDYESFLVNPYWALIFNVF